MLDGVQHDGFANQGRIGRIAAPPERIADNDDILFAWRFFLRGKSAAELGRSAQKGEEVGRDERAPQAFGFAVTGNIPLRRR